MTDPYGRDTIPAEPKNPSYFSILRPFVVFLRFNIKVLKFLLWGFLCASFVFAKLWKVILEDAEKNFVPKIAAVCFGFFVYLLLGILLLCLCAIFLSIFAANTALNSWHLWLCYGSVLILMYVAYYAFNLDQERSAEYWSKRLIGKSIKLNEVD